MGSNEGTKYQGWQRLKGSSENTIQGKIETVLSKMTGEEIQIIGSGRTDAGTHAYGQVANFHTMCQKEVANIQSYLNQYLPQDIVVTQVKEVDERFHSRFHAVDKTYLYRIWTEAYPPVFERAFVHWEPQRLDLKRLQEGARLLIGEHDFQGFSNKKTKKSTIRWIKEIHCDKIDHELRIYIKGDGFLYNMVRIMVGTLLEIGLGKREVSTIEDVLALKERSQAGERLPAAGLVLYQVNYLE